jgi:hypothetical protein
MDSNKVYLGCQYGRKQGLSGTPVYGRQQGLPGTPVGLSLWITWDASMVVIMDYLGRQYGRQGLSGTPVWTATRFTWDASMDISKVYLGRQYMDVIMVYLGRQCGQQQGLPGTPVYGRHYGLPGTPVWIVVALLGTLEPPALTVRVLPVDSMIRGTKLENTITNQ